MKPARLLVQHDKFDDKAFNEAIDAVPEFDQVLADHVEHEALINDLFLTFFKSHVRVSDGPHADVIRALMDTGEWKRLHATTKFDATASGMAVASLARGLINQLPKGEDERRQRMRYLLAQAKHEVDDLLEFADAWGQTAGDSLGTDLSHVRKAQSKVQGKLKRIAEIAGRMRRVALQKHRTRTDHGADEVFDIKFGDDLSKLVPSELIALGHTVLRRDFMVRFAERRLMQYDVKSLEKLGRGPIVVAIDTSGSMSGPKEVWAKGVALGLMAIALEEKRDFAMILFSSAHEIQSTTFTGRPDLETLMESLELQYNGGTDFVAPLTEALKIMEKSAFEQADLIFITDGICAVPAAFLADFNGRRRQKQARVFTVLVDQGVSATAAVAEFSDGVERLSDLAQDGEVLDLVFGI
jgi:uncharacterized protein with von Willebrand factor type A (vWA) domain